MNNAPTNTTKSSPTTNANSSFNSASQSGTIVQLPPPKPAKPRLLLHNNKIFRPVENELYTGWEEAKDLNVVAGEPKFTWKGAKISWDLWAQIVCFMRWSQAEIREESMLFLFYHLVDKKWAAWVFPQHPQGMAVRMLPDHAIYKADRAKFGEGWIQAGTVHHHCNTKAFQSSTDAADEENRDGLHVTLGEMEKRSVDIHCRQVFDGVQSNTSLRDWIECPPWIKDAPPQFRGDFFHHAVSSVQNHPFPEEWKTRVYKFMPQAQAAERVFLGGDASGAAGAASGTKATLIGTSTPSSTTEKDTSEQSTNPNSGGDDTTHWAEKYRATRKARMREVLSLHKLDAEEALKLFVPNYHALNDDQKAVYHVIRDAFMKEGIVLLNVPEYLKDIAEEDLLATYPGF